MNDLQIIKFSPTKLNMESFVAQYIEDESISPLNKYLNLKSIEYMVKIALADKPFRDSVKEDYLSLTNGSTDRVEIMGTEIKTVSQEKKNVLAKTYLYSDKVIEQEREIDRLEFELKCKKDTLNGARLMDINNGTAVCLDTKEDTVTDSFNLIVKFKAE